jgi:hypothetical protein
MHACATTIRVAQAVGKDAIEQYRNSLTTFRGIGGNRGASSS